jgi:hypothetical protein
MRLRQRQGYGGYAHLQMVVDEGRQIDGVVGELVKTKKALSECGGTKRVW